MLFIMHVEKQAEAIIDVVGTLALSGDLADARHHIDQASDHQWPATRALCLTLLDLERRADAVEIIGSFQPTFPEQEAEVSAWSALLKADSATFLMQIDAVEDRNTKLSLLATYLQKNALPSEAILDASSQILTELLEDKFWDKSVFGYIDNLLERLRPERKEQVDTFLSAAAEADYIQGDAHVLAARHGVTLNPPNREHETPSFLHRLACAYADTGSWTSASEVLSKIQVTDWRYVDALGSLGCLQKEAGNDDGARATFLHAEDTVASMHRKDWNKGAACSRLACHLAKAGYENKARRMSTKLQFFPPALSRPSMCRLIRPCTIGTTLLVIRGLRSRALRFMPDAPRFASALYRCWGRCMSASVTSSPRTACFALIRNCARMFATHDDASTTSFRALAHWKTWDRQRRRRRAESKPSKFSKISRKLSHRSRPLPKKTPHRRC